MDATKQLLKNRKAKVKCGKDAARRQTEGVMRASRRVLVVYLCERYQTLMSVTFRLLSVTAQPLTVTCLTWPGRGWVGPLGAER